MTDLEFAHWWAGFSAKLKPGTEVFHWSAHSQHQLKGSFRVMRVEEFRVWIELLKPPTTKSVQRITLRGEPIGKPYEVPVGSLWGTYLTKESFFQALRLWHDYSAPDYLKEDDGRKCDRVDLCDKHHPVDGD